MINYDLLPQVEAQNLNQNDIIFKYGRIHTLTKNNTAKIVSILFESGSFHNFRFTTKVRKLP